MNLRKTTAAFLLSALMIGTTSVPLWAASTASQSSTTVQVASSSYLAPAALDEQSWLKPADAPRRTAASGNCAAGQMYSQHDLVGDPKSCIMQGVSLSAPSITSMGGVR